MNVYYLHKKTDFDVIRYSLRSLQYMKHDSVTIVGDLCDWMQGVGHWEIPDLMDDWTNTTVKIHEISKGHGKAVIMYDDVFLLKPYKPVLYCDRELKKKAERVGGIRGNNLRRTLAYLEGGYNFELHYPLPVDRQELNGIMEAADWKRGIQPFSLYGNLQNTFPVEKRRDCKVTGQNLILHRDDFFSTREHHEKEENRPFFEKIYPHKSKYEL